MRSLIAMCREAEAREGVLAATTFGGFALADMPDAGNSVVVVTDGDRGLAEEVRDGLLDRIWAEREAFVYRHRPIEEALAEARAFDGGPVILLDHADNCGSGATQDVMTAIEAAMHAGLEDVIVGAVWDPEAVAKMHEAGVGAEVDIDLGGRTDMPSIGERGRPLRVAGTVRVLTDGRWTVRGPMYTGVRVDMGPSAVLDTGAMQIVVVFNHHEPWDLGVFTSMGDPAAASPLHPAQVAHPLPRRIRRPAEADPHPGRQRGEHLGQRRAPLRAPAPAHLPAGPHQSTVAPCMRWFHRTPRNSVVVRAWSGEFLANPPEHGQIARMIPRGRKFRARHDILIRTSEGCRCRPCWHRRRAGRHCRLAGLPPDSAGVPDWAHPPSRRGQSTVHGQDKRLGIHSFRALAGGAHAALRVLREHLVAGTFIDAHSPGNARNSSLSISPRKWLVTLAARARSRIRTPSSMLRLKAASVRFAEVMKTASPSATTALAWSNSRRAVEFERSRVVVDAGPRFAGPVGRPESIGESAHELSRGGCVASFSLDVQ